MSDVLTFVRHGLVALLCAAPLLSAHAQDKPPRQALRVCQDPNNLPFSNVDGAGKTWVADPWPLIVCAEERTHVFASISGCGMEAKLPVSASWPTKK